MRVKCDYDLIIIGGGAAGLTAARTAASLGKRCALIEENKLGGCALWAGSVPRMALSKAGEVAAAHKKLHTFGVATSGHSFDTSNVMSVIQGRVEAVCQVSSLEKLAALGITVMYGRARFVNKRTVMIDGQKLSAKKYIIATGYVSTLPVIEGLESVPFVTCHTFWEREKLPASLIIFGADSCGVEYARALSNLGVQVTLIEQGQRLVPQEDADCATLVRKELERDGVVVKTETRIVRVSASGTGVQVTCSPALDKDATMTFAVRADLLYVATNKIPHTHDLGLETTGMSFGEPGICVNAHLRTTVSSIYACGGVVGAPDHAVGAQAVIAAHNACTGVWQQQSYDDRNVARMTLVGPELVSLGLTELQAHKKYTRGITVFTLRYQDVERGMVEQAHGIAKFVCDKKGRVLGAHIMGERASELMSSVQTLAAQGLPLYELVDHLQTYPAYADIVLQAACQTRKNVRRGRFIQRLFS